MSRPAVPVYDYKGDIRCRKMLEELRGGYMRLTVADSRWCSCHHGLLPKSFCEAHGFDPSMPPTTSTTTTTTTTTTTWSPSDDYYDEWEVGSGFVPDLLGAFVTICSITCLVLLCCRRYTAEETATEETDGTSSRARSVVDGSGQL